MSSYPVTDSVIFLELPAPFFVFTNCKLQNKPNPQKDNNYSLAKLQQRFKAMCFLKRQIEFYFYTLSVVFYTRNTHSPTWVIILRIFLYDFCLL